MRARAIPAAIVLALVAGLWIFLAGRALAENYGGLSRTQAARVEHAIAAWFRTDAAAMRCIAWRESGLNARAYNDDDWPTQSVAGVFQIAWPVWTPANPNVTAQPRRYGWVLRFWHHRAPTWLEFRQRLANPVQSIRLAWLLYRHEGGLRHWGGAC